MQPGALAKPPFGMVQLLCGLPWGQASAPLQVAQAMLAGGALRQVRRSGHAVTGGLTGGAGQSSNPSCRLHLDGEGADRHACRPPSLKGQPGDAKTNPNLAPA